MAPRQSDMDERIERIRTWAEQHGSTRIPQSAVTNDGYPLGARTRYLRDRYAKGLLDPAVIEKLEAIPGWAWSVRRPRTNAAKPRGIPVEWQEHLDRLMAHYQERGSLTGCSTSDHTWLRVQSDHLRYDRLSDEQIAALADHPVIDARIRRGWEPRGSKVSLTAEQLKRWLHETDAPDLTHLTRGSTVPNDEGKPVNLWRRCKYYRERYREGKLSPEEISTLEQLPGWRWEISPSERRRRAAAAR